MIMLVGGLNHVFRRSASGCRRSIAVVEESKRWKSNVGFVGLGNMGIPMAKNLLKNGYGVVGNDVSAERMDLLRGLDGAETADTLQQVAASSDAVITMLPESQHVLSAYAALLESSKPEQLFVDCSTISPESSKKVSDMAEQKGCKFLGAPVSGGVVGAENGTLTFMVGGDESTLTAAEHLLGSMGSRWVYCGPAGSGLVAKICNNMILGMTMAAVAEAMNLGIKLGMEPKVLASVINTSTGRCWASEINNPVPGAIEKQIPSNNNYLNGFKADLLLKDMRLGESLAKETHTQTPLTRLTVDVYARISQMGWGDKDFSIAYKYFKEQQS
ncbi:3-hydroxyisobutyrate dehydrogenase, mitochondrial [Metopolophium dirhodum]|uniref:3-hydroxyisobutyrate dehydrogenase, mitochondrial n=1 Tax=Metopolophium dirhodum TaxID=44670 RepID=UPI00299001E6|nr:3-hydroxyisobutyrate dehydrogenase, mitochondrial [Metopolophium dirhodum]